MKNPNNYSKVVHSLLFFGEKIALSKILKDCYHHGYWSDSGGKVEEGESLMEAVWRETKEETGLDFPSNAFELIDCYIYPKRELKTFLFKVQLEKRDFPEIENLEPTKHSNWQLFTIEEALKLRKLMPSVRHFLKSLDK